MAHAYTPGLKVSDSITIRKRRILPLKGEVIVLKGSKVTPNQVVARTYLPGEVQPLNVANMLNMPPEDIPSSMFKKEGDPIEKGEIIAESKGFFGLFKSRATATISGTIESISNITGQVLQRGKPIPVEVIAYIDGEVIEVIESEGVIVSTRGAFVQGIFGIGGETAGPLRMVCDKPEEVLTPERISDSHKGAIIVGGSLVTADALKKAIETGVRGVVVGGFDDKDLRAFLGYDLGVAITGSENLGITLVVTEGFGTIAMAQQTFELLNRHENMEACINGATQIRAGVIRPEVIIPLEESAGEEKDDAAGTVHGLSVGSPVRVIRQPYFGRLGKVIALPSNLMVLESGSRARVLEVEFSAEERAIIPRANVELIEA